MISTFTAGLHQSHFVKRGTDDNQDGELSTLNMGDLAKGGGSDDRRSMLHTWDLASPDAGSAPIPKHAIIDSATVDWTAAGTSVAADDQATHALALMAPDGHWDRGSQHPLQYANGAGVTWSAPSISSTIKMMARSLTNLLYDTMPTTTGSTAFNNSAETAYQGLGSTLYLPPGENMLFCVIPMYRREQYFPDNPTIKLKAWSLCGDGRHYALDEVIGESLEKNYGDLAYFGWGGSPIFQFSPAIDPTASGRWIGITIEGGILDWDMQGYRTIAVKHLSNPDQDSYYGDTGGSMITGTVDPALRWDNALPLGYQTMNDAPALYPAGSSTVLTTPYQRHFGDVMVTARCDPWTSAERKSYGSPTSGADEIFAALATNIQAFIASEHYSPATGRSRAGLLMEVPTAEFAVWNASGPGHPTRTPFQLTLEWHPNETAVRAESRSRQRVAAAGSRASDRVQCDPDARERVFAAADCRQRVRAADAEATQRVRAPYSNARSEKK